MRTQIAAVVNLHQEGSAAIPSLVSAWRGVRAAIANGFSAQLVLVLDSADAQTHSLAQQWKDRGAHILVVSEGDLGAARNAAAQDIDAEWLAFLDADDLWGEQWLPRALEAATHAPPSVTIDVWHPEVNVIFGDHHSLLHHIDSTSAEFSWARMRLHNSWTALSVVRRSHLLSLPYPRNDLAQGFGFEDWSWNAEVLRRGGRHRVVPNTCHFIRRRSPTPQGGTLLQQSQRALRTPYRIDDSVVHIDPERLPGATTRVSELSPVSPELPATHRHLPVALSPEVLADVRLAATVEPSISQTIGRTAPATLPQNTNLHVGETQQALEELDLLSRGPAFTSHAELIARSERTAALDGLDQARVISEVLLDQALASIPRGTSPQIEAAMHRFPQLRRSTW